MPGVVKFAEMQRKIIYIREDIHTKRVALEGALEEKAIKSTDPHDLYFDLVRRLSEIEKSQAINETAIKYQMIQLNHSLSHFWKESTDKIKLSVKADYENQIRSIKNFTAAFKNLIVNEVNATYLRSMNECKEMVTIDTIALIQKAVNETVKSYLNSADQTGIRELISISEIQKQILDLHNSIENTQRMLTEQALLFQQQRIWVESIVEALESTFFDDFLALEEHLKKKFTGTSEISEEQLVEKVLKKCENLYVREPKRNLREGNGFPEEYVSEDVQRGDGTRWGAVISQLREDVMRLKQLDVEKAKDMAAMKTEIEGLRLKSRTCRRSEEIGTDEGAEPLRERDEEPHRARRESGNTRISRTRTSSETPFNFSRPYQCASFWEQSTQLLYFPSTVTPYDYAGRYQEDWLHPCSAISAKPLSGSTISEWTVDVEYSGSKLNLVWFGVLRYNVEIMKANYMQHESSHGWAFNSKIGELIAIQAGKVVARYSMKSTEDKTTTFRIRYDPVEGELEIVDCNEPLFFTSVGGGGLMKLAAMDRAYVHVGGYFKDSTFLKVAPVT